MEESNLYIWATEGNAKDGHLPLEPDMFAYQHEPLTPRSRAPSSQFKLRSSCDACGQAKIKCDRGRPACARCLSQGASCVYGVSRKAGKPARRRPTTTTALSLPPSRPGELETTTTSADLPDGGHDDIDLMVGLAEGAMGMTPRFSASDPAFQSWFSFDGLESLGALTPCSSDQDTCISRQSDSALKLVESTPSTTTTIAAAAAASPHSCTRESKDIMRRLYCANPSTPMSDGVPARTLDLGSVLTRSREVVGRLELLLKCPCARSAHMAMLYASIVSRILLWYQQAAWSATSTSTSAGTSSLPSTPAILAAQDPMLLLSNSAMLKTFDAEAADDNSSGVSVLPTPVMVGTFQSDDRNLQTALTNCLLLSELRKVGSLIDSFISIGTGTSNSQTTGDACPTGEEFRTGVADASLFASLGTWLRTEHGRIVQKARSGLSVLDENLRP
ncbi:hypothetical protein BJ170DRAFT_639895 [Xylariales sp. AK1849]|nr:hypothetical protein BJ170DRAFT_639895 [Xylariales sp. AK1849]